MLADVGDSVPVLDQVLGHVEFPHSSGQGLLALGQPLQLALGQVDCNRWCGLVTTKAMLSICLS